MANIIIDPAHGGCDTRFIYGERRDKADNLVLANELKDRLSQEGIDAVLTRTEDIYIPIYERVNIANQLGGDFLLSFSWVGPSFVTGLPRIKFFVSEEGGVATELAENIIMNLPSRRYEVVGIELNTELPILTDVTMPGLFMEIEYPQGNITNTEFEMISNEMAMAISRGMMQTFGDDMEDNMIIGESIGDGLMEEEIVEDGLLEEIENDIVNPPMEDEDMDQMPVMYSVQVGLFRNESNAENMLRELTLKGYDGSIQKKGDFFSVHVGEFDNMDDAVAIERVLRTQGYNTLLVTVDEG